MALLVNKGLAAQASSGISLIDQTLNSARVNQKEYPSAGVIFHMQSKFPTGVPDEVKWQILFAAKAHLDVHGIIHLGSNFSPDVLVSYDHLAILSRILSSYHAFEKTQLEGKFAIFHKHLEKIEGRFRKDLMEKGDEILGSLRKQNDASLQPMIEDLEATLARGKMSLQTPCWNTRIPLSSIDPGTPRPSVDFGTLEPTVTEFEMGQYLQQTKGEPIKWNEFYSFVLTLAHTKFSDELLLNMDKVLQGSSPIQEVRIIDARLKMYADLQGNFLSLAERTIRHLEECERVETGIFAGLDKTVAERPFIADLKKSIADRPFSAGRLGMMSADVLVEKDHPCREIEQSLAEIRKVFDSLKIETQDLREKKVAIIEKERTSRIEAKRNFQEVVAILRGEKQGTLTYKSIADVIYMSYFLFAQSRNAELPKDPFRLVQGYRPYSNRDEVAFDGPHFTKLKEALSGPFWRVIQMPKFDAKGDKVGCSTYIRNSDGKTCDVVSEKGEIEKGIAIDSLFAEGSNPAAWDHPKMIFFPAPPSASKANLY